MKALAIIMVFLCNFSLSEAPHSDVTILTALKSQSKDSVITNDLRIRPFHLEIIPPSSGVQFYRNGILFLSYSKMEEKVPERHLSFGSVRTYTSMVSDTIPVNIEQFEIKGTDLFPSEATTFTSDFNTMYLSLIPEKSRSEKIFRAQYTSDGWKIDEKPLEICNESYIYSHPCLSVDETFMLFSSDQSGSYGGLDLWITRRKSGEGWSNPVNIGKNINSAGNELFATLDSNNNIYFSSDGHHGKGGYDIFVARYNGSTWDEPQILPDEINTKDDELAYTINKKDNKTAFYNSRSRSGKSRTQLYLIDLSHSHSQKGINNLSDYFFAILELKSTTNKDISIAKGETPESEEENVLSGKPVLPSPVAQVTNEEIPESDKVRGKFVPQTTKEATPQNNPVTVTQVSEVKKETPTSIKPVPVTGSSEIKDDVVYRVQLLAHTKPVGSQDITVSGKSYKSFEYLYKGGYRTTIGEFGTLAEAVRLQNTCRQNGYKEAFVVAFKNNVRSTDPALFK